MKKLLLIFTLCLGMFAVSCGNSTKPFDKERARQLCEKYDAQGEELTEAENEEAAMLLISYLELQNDAVADMEKNAKSWDDVRRISNEFEEKYGDYRTVLHPYDFMKASKSLRRKVNDAKEKNAKIRHEAEARFDEKFGDN